jgi:hypothetical protein
MAKDGLKIAGPDTVLDGVRISELANKAYFLDLKQLPAERQDCSSWCFQLLGGCDKYPSPI